ncbi:MULTISPECIES: thiamine ABC transporter substrate-binding protein [unclassified Actinomyces]|uniref:thiamine ABC transporter substrate-binding protein n=1 Tax=unclassified Actinomyces TaxID=2609248 RepID=UPI002017C458|nr:MULTISPECIES: thiamine ABC transporter substrate-binding protein [unclassified Actinomyces]MCL3777250.1 thiamine ABC transporter substrate-binding protein [Actinomyces sp. AC-20-1]MCL3789526.1 thiamine ABC transporter substrate-binding protein [Actinomyces sp. 187325]MCL3792355.1 thiamine ABC transporter substrate-binding protein [Actinomyces sp. 186855]MCL3793611.1 thiamine ABC transporter substrate-binding protein [Actinomyces sp. 217892]
MTTLPNRPIARRALLTGAALGAVGLTLAACGSRGADGDTQAGASTVAVLTHDSFHVPDELIAAFESSTGLTLELVPAGDAGELVNKLVLTKDAPLGDAVYGIDNTFASRALGEGVIDTGVTVTLPDGVDVEQYLVADTPALVPVDFGEVCLNTDTTWFTEHGLAEPTSFEDLTKPEHKGLSVLINPTSSSTGLAFLVATIGHFGEGAWQQYWKDLVANGAKIDEGWSDAYYTDFSGSGEGGTYPIVVSYSSSPAATVSEDGTTSTTASVPATATRQVEYAGVLAGAANPEGATAFIEWMLSVEVQESIPDNMYMYPVNTRAALSEEIEAFGAVSRTPVVVDPADIDANREAWLAAWTEAVGA